MLNLDYAQNTLSQYDNIFIKFYYSINEFDSMKHTIDWLVKNNIMAPEIYIYAILTHYEPAANKIQFARLFSEFSETIKRMMKLSDEINNTIQTIKNKMVRT